MSIKLRLEKYLTRRAFSSPWTINGLRKTGLSGAVVIPALAESSNLAATLESLAQNPEDLLNQFLVVIVVNHREDAALEDKADNLATLSMLPELADRLPMNLGWIDAASPGLELTVRDGGVGMARKLGFDLALPRLAWHGSEPILVALDGDTLVDPNYLASIIDHFEHSQCGGAVIPFHHRPARTQTEQDIINRYELFLRSYVFGLDLAGSPYAFHTVGSAMACTGSAYLRAGGMNTRRAAEDFYFLQQLKKTSGVGQVRGTVVFPSSRPSHRVPFGTGRSVAKALASEEGATTFYRPECYRLLGEWLSLAASSFGLPGGQVMQAAEGISSTLARYLNEEGFLSAWERISLVKRTADTFWPAFHEWFDALRTMKLIHSFSADDFHRCTPEEALPPLLEMGGYEPITGVTAQLELLRNLQQVR